MLQLDTIYIYTISMIMVLMKSKLINNIVSINRLAYICLQ